jgi:hypothetical protein
MPHLLAGRAFAVNPDPIGLLSHGTKDRIDDKPKHVNPGANAADAGKTGSAGKVDGTRSPQPPEVAGEIFKKKDERFLSIFTSNPAYLKLYVLYDI